MMPGSATVFMMRGIGVALAALGGIWVARVLGPEKLGMSTFVLAFVGLAGTLTSLNQNYNFVRRGKNVAGEPALNKLIGDVFSLRLAIALLLASAGLVAVAVTGIREAWYLAIGAGVVMALAQANDAGWVLQLRGRMPWLFVAMSLQSGLTGLLCIALIRPDWPAGSDLVMGAVGSVACFALAWWFACGGWPPGFQVSAHGALDGLRLLKGGRWLALMGLGTFVLSTAEMPLIGFLASVEELGVYRTALQFINLMNPFLPLFFYKLYPQLIELQQASPSAVIPTQFRALGRVALFGVPLIAGAFLLAPWVYPLVFGPAFAGAAMPFAILFAGKVASVGANIFMWGGFARHRDREVVLVTLAVACLSLAMNVVLIPRIGLIGAAMVSCLAQCVLLGGYIMVMFRSSAKAVGSAST